MTQIVLLELYIFLTCISLENFSHEKDGFIHEISVAIIDDILYFLSELDIKLALSLITLYNSVFP